ncbi:superoxide dismutase family protein [Thalassospira marina]|uniref:Superoxide dismutase n=1 Tax=Thalassospira marina TaxID=2048283 RepID=A0A2N3KZH1_9PROT|nr:superoxide dismutase family protein [Thalassospira marina]AUG52044.1 superoxide dismutase [Thalassospira marina]PKR55971.1 superoxide dismutase [Thalassospira marina]
MRAIIVPLIALFAGAVSLVAFPAFAETSATATFHNSDGTNIGTADLTETDGGVVIKAEVSGLPSSQWVAFHIHENGKCDTASNFKTAGGHFNPTHKSHGFLTKDGPHAGDMPNQYVNDEGKLFTQVIDTNVMLDDKTNGVRGKAIVIHAGADDYMSQPSGAAGDRLACAIIE